MSKSPSLHLAIDLGAGSGRIMAGAYDNHRLTLTETARFSCPTLELNGHLRWDFPRILDAIRDGLKKTTSQFPANSIASCGIDTWGVDYGLFDENDRLLDPPFQYRDTRNNGMMERAFARIPRDELYALTGLQFMPFNSVFQILADADTRPDILARARTLLFMPGLVAQALSGLPAREVGSDITMASTSQLLDPATRTWHPAVLQRLGIPASILPPLHEPGIRLPIKSSASGALPSSAALVSVASHDTGSAVAAVPSEQDSYAFLSSGTWSILGVVVPDPVRTPAALKYGFSNELGVDGTVRLLKNVCGGWLIQQCRGTWEAQGQSFEFKQLDQLADACKPFTSLIDPDHPDFVAPGDMPSRIQNFCRRTGQPVPQSPGEISRVIFDSLAAKLALVLSWLLEVTPVPLTALHVVGGGANNRRLNQDLADATGIPVHAGPVEATALGNVLVQLKTLGLIGSLAEGRRLVRSSFPIETYTPRPGAPWKEALQRLRALMA